MENGLSSKSLQPYPINKTIEVYCNASNTNPSSPESFPASFHHKAFLFICCLNNYYDSIFSDKHTQIITYE